MERYFITNAGLAAAVKDEQLLADLTAVLRGQARKDVVAKFRKQGLLDIDRRPATVDNNELLLSGGLLRIRDALSLGNGHGQHPNGPAPESADASGSQRDEVAEDLRTRPRKLYRLRADRPALTKDQLRSLPSGARHVYLALQRSDVGTTKSLAAVTNLNRRTVENSLGALRKAGVLEDFDYTR